MNLPVFSNFSVDSQSASRNLQFVRDQWEGPAPFDQKLSEVKPQEKLGLAEHELLVSEENWRIEVYGSLNDTERRTIRAVIVDSQQSIQNSPGRGDGTF